MSNMTSRVFLLVLLASAGAAAAAPKGAKKPPPKKAPVIIPVPAQTVVVPAAEAEAPAPAPGSEPAAASRTTPAAAPEPPAAPSSARKAPEDAPSKSERPAPPAASTEDLARLRAEYAELRDALFRSRARAETVEGALFSTRIAATLRWKGGKEFTLRRARLRLDDTLLWDSGASPRTDGPLPAGERSVAPGMHRLTLRLEVRGQDGELGYSSEHSFAVRLPEGKRTEVRITADEDGDGPEYEPQVSLEIGSGD